MYPKPVAHMCQSIVKFFLANSTKGLVGLMRLDINSKVRVLIPIVAEPLPLTIYSSPPLI